MQTAKGIGLLLAAAAAYGAYRYSRMSAEQKNDLRQRGKDFLDKEIKGVSNMFKKKSTATTTSNGY